MCSYKKRIIRAKTEENYSLYANINLYRLRQLLSELVLLFLQSMGSDTYG